MFLWKVVSGELPWLLVLKAVSCSRPLFRMSRHWLTTASCATSLEVARGPERMLDTPLCSTMPPRKCGDIYPSTVAEIRHAQTNVFVFALVTALLPESTQTGNHWPEPVRPGGVQQPEEAGAQGGGCVHRPWQWWQGWSPGWVHSLSLRSFAQVICTVCTLLSSLSFSEIFFRIIYYVPLDFSGCHLRTKTKKTFVFL